MKATSMWGIMPVVTVAAISVILGCGEHGSDEKVPLALRKSRMQLISALLTAEAIENKDANDIRKILHLQTNGFLAVPASTNTFYVNTNLAAWRNSLSNATDEIAIYFPPDNVIESAWGQTFSRRFIKFDIHAEGRTFLDRFATR